MQRGCFVPDQQVWMRRCVWNVVDRCQHKGSEPRRGGGGGDGGGGATRAQNGLGSLKVNFLACSYRLPGPSMLMAATNGQR